MRGGMIPPAADGGRRRGESVIPMINVVFLLLVFFMMSATLRAPGPVPAEPPRAAPGADPAPRGPGGRPDAHPGGLWIGADGAFAWGDLRGEAALDAAAAAFSGGAAALVTADRAAPGAALSAALRALALRGVPGASLRVTERGGA